MIGLKRAAVAALMFSGVARAGAQTTEMPIPFDSAGQLRVITPLLVTRFTLHAPEWPVSTTFTEARLYAITGGAYVIAADRGDGTIDRYALTSNERDALQRAVSSAIIATGGLVTHEWLNPEPPARGAFVRNQMILTAFIYAPAASALTHDGKAGAAVWLLATGGSYFALSALARHANIMASQNHLSTDGGLRGAILTNATLHALGVDASNDAAIGVGLAGALGGAIVGYKIGKTQTDAAAHAITAASTLGGLTALGIAAAIGTLDDSSSRRGASGAAVAGALAGYVLGPKYTRRRAYDVTEGDVGMVGLSSVLGAAVSAIPFAGADSIKRRSLAGALTAGMLAGVVIGDRAFARPYNHTRSEMWRVRLGALAGGLIGGAAVVIAEPNATAGMSFVVAGALAGTIATDRLLAPARSNRRAASRTPQRTETRAALASSRVHVEPGNVAAFLFGRPGTYTLMRVAF